VNPCGNSIRYKIITTEEDFHKDREEATENAGVEKSGADRRCGKCRSRLAIWKAEPILYSDTALSDFFKKCL